MAVILPFLKQVPVGTLILSVYMQNSQNYGGPICECNREKTAGFSTVEYLDDNWKFISGCFWIFIFKGLIKFLYTENLIFLI